MWLICNAQCVFTDSFHGTAFSINLGKTFCSFPKGKKNDRQSINSRLKDILIECGLGERFVEDIGSLEDVLHQQINKDDVKKRIVNKLEFSRQFLKDSLM